MELNIRLRASDGDPLSDMACCCHVVGSLLYLVVTRLDISYPIHILLFLLPPLFTIVSSSVFFDIFVARSLVVSSFPVQLLTTPCLL
jgi:hypothetical protein